jgi:hypothetical protein
MHAIDGTSDDRIASAKRAFATRRLPARALHQVLSLVGSPRSGDVVLARVDAVGHHKSLERIDGRRCRLFAGDEIVLAYGDRYAPDQFHAQVPDDYRSCHLAAAGGLIALVTEQHARMAEPTSLTPLARIGDAAGLPLRLARFRLAPPPTSRRIPTLAVVGTAMNAGKTTTCAALIRGLARSGVRVGAAKLTGTAAGGDTWAMRDAGARHALDFTDAGLASTYRVPIAEVEAAAGLLLDHLAASCEAAVVEVADGLLQTETRALVAGPLFRERIDGVVFAANDAMGAAAGVEWLRSAGLHVVAVSGALTASPLATAEAAAITGLPCLTIEQLDLGAAAIRLMAGGPERVAA